MSDEQLLAASRPDFKGRRLPRGFCLRLWLRAGACLLRPRLGEAAFAAFAASVHGELPGRPSRGYILLGCDGLYLRNFAVPMLLSIEQLGAEQDVHVHVFAPDDASPAELAALAGRLRAVRLTWTWSDMTPAAGLRHKVVFLTAGRYLVARLLLAKTRSRVLVLDADGTARRPIWPAYEPLAAGGDVGLVRRETRKVWRKVLACAVGINPTRRGRRFLSATSRLLLWALRKDPDYHVDQAALHCVDRIAGLLWRGYRTFAIPIAFGDHDLGPDAVLWTAKGWKNKLSPGYAERRAALLASRPIPPAGKA